MLREEGDGLAELPHVSRDGGELHPHLLLHVLVLSGAKGRGGGGCRQRNRNTEAKQPIT